MLRWHTTRRLLLVFNATVILLHLLVFRTPGNDGITSIVSKQVLTPHQEEAWHAVCHNQESFDVFHDESSRSGDHDDKKNQKKSPGKSKSSFHSPLANICSKLDNGQATASSLWQKHLSTILNATIHPNDIQQVHKHWTQQLVKQLLTPQVLEKGLRSFPNHKAMHELMTIVQHKLQNMESAPPLEVLIVGGSVTEGSGCDVLPPETHLPPNTELPTIRGRDCAWPHRLQLILDAVLGEGVVRLHNLAVGGTGSVLSVPVLDYWLFPEGSELLKKGPDLILNGYAANDNLPPWDFTTNSRNDNITGTSMFFDNYAVYAGDLFIRKALQSRPCLGDPPVIFVDEYTGNQHDVIVGELQRFEAIDLLTTMWYGHYSGHISSAHAVRKIIMANTESLVFSANWVKRGQRRVDVHFGQPGHITIALTVAYSLFSMALNFCQEEMVHHPLLQSWENVVEQQQQQQKDHQIHHNTSRVAPWQLFLNAETKRLVEQEIPPNLNEYTQRQRGTDIASYTQIKGLAQRWRQTSQERHRAKQQFCGKKSGSSVDPPCPFAFIAAPAGTHANAGKFRRFLKDYAVNTTGWNIIEDIRNGWQNKLGYQTTQPNATTTFLIKNTASTVRKMTIQSLKSYGETWANSTARFTLKWTAPSSESYETFLDVTGYHNSHTSISYSSVLDLGVNHTAPKGSTVQLRADLIGGTTFKLIGVMLCSR